ncbi:MAG: M23 family metallopeptidase [Pygmaiobacter massiliensis]|nr:M23 family metallopeptidase [Pygmaiobacter massiliensis]
MWERELTGPTQMPPPDKPKPQQKHAGVLWVQCLLCMALFAAAFAFYQLDRTGFCVFGEQYLAYLQQGTSLANYDKVFRFAEQNMEGVRAAALDLVQKASDYLTDQFGYGLAQSEAGQGGPAQTKETDDHSDVSLGSYLLSDRPFLPVDGFASSSFGSRLHPITHRQDFHTGIDLACAESTPVYAAFGGVVTECGQDDTAGLFVKVSHSQQVQTFYCHLSCILVRENQQLRRGECLGLVGQTGSATGPHLHFELIIDGLRVDPAQALQL